MKKLMFLAVIAMVLTVFNSCQKDELQIDPGTDLTAKEKPDVYMEEDYLVFKDYETLDSVANKLNKTSTEKLLLHEKALGFESARAYRYKTNEDVLAIEKFEEFETAIQELAKKRIF